jgi:hypothetical protein
MTSNQGKSSLGLLIAASVLVLAGLFFASFLSFPVTDRLRAEAASATSTVTVLNTPPLWTTDAQEEFESSTSSPTNAGSNVNWIGTSDNPNNNLYYLLICKTTSTPTPNAGAAPTCAGGGGNLWAVSTATSPTVQARAIYYTTSSNPQTNVWVGWICDGNAFNPRCNAVYKQGTGNTASPFIVNHRPNFPNMSNDTPKVPGALITWTTVASDTDAFTGSQDTVQLFVCKSNDFTGAACGSGGTWCSTTATTTNPTCNATTSIPFPDAAYPSYGYIIDNHNFAASLGAQGSNSSLTISNVAPSIASSSISLIDWSGSGPLTLTNAGGQTSNFQVKFTVSDNNSCMSSTGTQEIASTITNVYRTGITSSSCINAGQYNPNNCYPNAIGTTTWSFVCTQDGGACPNTSTISAAWTCTFPLWYLADPTDGTTATNTQYFSQGWISTVRATDNNGATSSLVEAATSTELVRFLAMTLDTSIINYGSLSAGSTTDPLVATSSVTDLGNIGLDHNISGTSMCTTFPTPGCNDASTTSTIPANQQRYATTAVAFGSAIPMSTSSLLFSIHIPKPTVTSTPTASTTFWGINIPSAIQLAGNYYGQNTVIGVQSPATSW